MTATATTNPIDARMLREAFDSFAEVSSNLERAYNLLQQKVRRLSDDARPAHEA